MTLIFAGHKIRESPSGAYTVMRLGVIDIGTNSVKLLVAEANGSIPRILLERVVITRIGEGLRDGGRLAQHAMDRTLRAVRGLVDEARRLGVLRARAVGTAAFRSASNRADFVRSLQRIGLRLEILSGRREADLSFAAATADLPIAGPVAVVDVGGGSAEMAWGTGSRRRRISLPLGAVRLTEQLLHNDPIQSADFQALLASIRATLRKALRTAGPLPGHVVAVGGTAATLAAMQLGLRRPVPERIHGLRLTRSQLYVLLIVLSLLTAQQRAAMPGLEPGRADIIVAGTAVLAATLGALRVSELTVSTRGLRYGVLLESLKSGARDKFA